MARDFYAVLAVAKTATDDQIRQRFRQLARERHPDHFAGEQKQAAELEFQEITQAFNVLSDPERRRLHELDLSKRQEPASDPKQLVRLYLQRGVRAYREKNWVEAADNFDRATKADPGSAQGWYNLALTCAQNPTWLTRGVAAIDRAFELESMNPGYWKLACRILALSQLDGYPQVRIGIDSGSAVRRGGDWYGSTVNAAARVAALESDIC